MPAIQTQAEADEKMVDLPSTGESSRCRNR